MVTVKILNGHFQNRILLLHLLILGNFLNQYYFLILVPIGVTGKNYFILGKCQDSDLILSIPLVVEYVEKLATM